MKKENKIYKPNDKAFANLDASKFVLAQSDKKLSDAKFEDKPIGFLKDAWIRFRKNKASIVATIIIVLIILFSLLTPLAINNYDSTFMDTYYSKKGPRVLALRKFGIATGSVNRDLQIRGYIYEVAIGIAAEDGDGKGDVTIGEGMQSKFQPVYKLRKVREKQGANRKMVTVYNADIDVYLEVGFIYKSITQSEYQKIVAWQNETGIQVLYPLIENNDYCADTSDANYWFKSTAKGDPIQIQDGEEVKIDVSDLDEDIALEDNYMRDENGNAVYYRYTGGGDASTAQYKVRILYYNYYIYQNGFEPNYLLGTETQGYDMALRLADGIRLSLLVALSVSIINMIIGCIYGAIEGYYGGTTDLIMERIADVLAYIPFMVVMTLFQIHLAKKLGPIVSLLLAYVITGWIGYASLVRTQFYRFKNQEYVMSARTLGASDMRIITRHIFPNAIGTMITSCALSIPGVIGSESMLSYLGIVNLGGTKTTSLGTLLADARPVWTNYPHLLLFPALILSLMMICFNLFGNGLRDAFNPSLRGTED